MLGLLDREVNKRHKKMPILIMRSLACSSSEWRFCRVRCLGTLVPIRGSVRSARHRSIDHPFQEWIWAVDQISNLARRPIPEQRAYRGH